MKGLAILAISFSLSQVICAANPELPHELMAESKPGRRSELAIDLASQAIDRARTFYQEGKTAEGAEQLELVARLADECFKAAQDAHKSKYWKRAELKISALRRRLDTLTQDLGYEQRDKAQELADHLNSVHDKLLAGVMRK